MEAAAKIAVVLLAIIAVFQVALAAGAPWGRAAWGGLHDGVLPTRLRVASAVTGFLLYPAFAIVVTDVAGLTDLGLSPIADRTAMVALAGFFGIGALANLVSRSWVERYWSLVSGALAVCCGVIASNL